MAPLAGMLQIIIAIVFRLVVEMRDGKDDNGARVRVLLTVAGLAASSVDDELAAIARPLPDVRNYLLPVFRIACPVFRSDRHVPPWLLVSQP